MKKGFTLGEMVVTVGVVAFLALILMPMLKDMMPNQEQAMFKKAYYITERAIAELVNDDDLYPEPEIDQEPYLGNTVKVPYKGEEYGAEDDGSDDDKKAKFCGLFTSKLNRASKIFCAEEDENGNELKKFTDGVDPIGNITTTDGMVWLLPLDKFEDNDDAREIYIDVNGKKKPNCFYNKTNGVCKKPDRFTIKVYQDGRVMVDGTMEIEYLNKVNISKNAKAETEQAKKDEEDELK